MTGFVSSLKVFFVDDDPALREANVQALELAGFDVSAFQRAEAALEALSENFDGVVITDIRMPGMDGLQLFGRIRDIDPEIPVILITGHGDIDMAVKALHDGAFDFVAKPFAADHLAASTRKALENRRLVLENRRLRALADAADSPLIGDSPAITRLRHTIEQVGHADVDVLIEGETGTGKELVAVMLHRKSRRTARPFVPVNCASLPGEFAEAELFGHAAYILPHLKSSQGGRIEASNRGTLFLDEIDGMPLSLQARLLRVIEEREVLRLGADEPLALDLRVIAAAKPGLAQMVEDGLFRSDLYFRLNVVRLSIPPLRERRDDIPQLFAHFVQEASRKAERKKFRMTAAMRRHLIEHEWPGNVRELRNFAFEAVLDLHEAGQPARDSARATLPELVSRYEETLVREALEETRGSVSRACELLGVPRKTLYDKFRRANIVPETFRRK